MFLKKNDICFDSSLFCNDIGFSVKSAINSKRIFVDKTHYMYVYLRRIGSLTTINTVKAFNIRLEMKINSYILLKEANLSSLAPHFAANEMKEAFRLYGARVLLTTFWKLLRSRIVFYDLYSYLLLPSAKTVS